MDEQTLAKLADDVLGRIFIELEASGRHVHITKAQAHILFGHDLTPDRPPVPTGSIFGKRAGNTTGPQGQILSGSCLGSSAQRSTGGNFPQR